MQATKIRFGKEYAVTYQGTIHALRVDEIINIKSSEHPSSNYVAGTLTTIAAEDDPGRVKYPVADVLDEIEAYRELVAEKARQKLEAEALIAARIAKKERAATLLAHAIGVHVIFETRSGDYQTIKHLPHVSATHFDSIGINEKALDALIDYLEAQGVTAPVEDELEVGE